VFLQEFFALVVIPDVFHKPGRIDAAVPAWWTGTPCSPSSAPTSKTDQVVIFVAAVVMMVALDQLVARTRIGRGIRATAQDPEAAVLMGVNIDTIVRLTSCSAARWAGVAGVLYAMEFENISYKIGFVLGIRRSPRRCSAHRQIRGALVGGIALGLVENWGAIFFGSQWKDVIAFVILGVVLLFRPTGILGESLQQARA